MEFNKEDSYRVKGIAVIFLVFHHLCYRDGLFQEFGMRSILPVSTVVNLAVLARVCVTIFVFVSAYGLASIFTKTGDSAGRFIYKRWLRLMSAFWIVYPLQIAFTYMNGETLNDKFQGEYYLIIFDFLGLSDFFQSASLTGINWYMFLAQLIIAITPVMCSATRKYGFLTLLYIFILMQFMSGILGGNNGGDLIGYAFAIGLGNYCATNEVFHRFKVKKKSILIVCSGFVFLSMLYLKYKMSQSSFDFKWLQNVALSVAALSLCVFVTIVLSKDVVFKYLGKYSSNIYFIHIFIVWCKPLHRYFTHVIVLVPVIVLISFVLSYFIESVKKLAKYDKIIMFLGNVSFPFH